MSILEAPASQFSERLLLSSAIMSDSETAANSANSALLDLQCALGDYMKEIESATSKAVEQMSEMLKSAFWSHHFPDYFGTFQNPYGISFTDSVCVDMV